MSQSILRQYAIADDVHDWYRQTSARHGLTIKAIQNKAIARFCAARKSVVSGKLPYYSPGRDSASVNVYLVPGLLEAVERICDRDSVSVRTALHTAIQEYYEQEKTAS